MRTWLCFKDASPGLESGSRKFSCGAICWKRRDAARSLRGRRRRVAGERSTLCPEKALTPRGRNKWCLKNSLEGLKSRFKIAEKKKQRIWRESNRNYLLKNRKNENGTKVNGASETCGTTDRHACNGRGKERLEKIFEKIMSENSANLIENINLHMHVAQQTQLG